MKRKLMAAIVSAMTIAGFAVPYGQAFPVLKAEAVQLTMGDINGDSILNNKDIQLLQSYIIGESRLTADEKGSADLTGDGKVNVLDLSLLKRKVSDKSGLLLINEACSTNKGCLEDSNGQTPDWIEIYNPSEMDISLSGIGVSDRSKNKFKFVFPENAVIEAGGYVLVYCDDALYTGEGEYHAAFKLSSMGETVYLTKPDGTEIDSVELPELTENTTYGRYENGSDVWTYLTATPGKSNDTAERLDLVERPLFSVEGGFYSDAFDLELTDKNGNTIYYTTDGSDPRTSDTVKVYDGSINIYNNTSDRNLWSAIADISLYGYTPPKSNVDKGIIVRAVSKNAGGTFSPVATNGYFIGKTATYYTDMKVISMSTDSDYLFDEDTGAYMIGSGYYNWKNSSSYVNYDAGDTNNPTNYNKEGKETEFPVNIQVFEQGKLAYTSDVGARISGAWSRAYPQKSIRIYARSEYGDSKMKYEFIEGLTDINGNPIKEFDKLTIRNGGTDNQLLHMRDMFIQELCSDRNVDIQGGEPCVMFIDGEFWGFYFIREKLETDYLESHYGIDKNDITVIKNSALDEGSQAFVNEYNSLLKWAAHADMTDAANYKKVCDAIDIQSFMDIIVIETYINNADWATDYLNNFMLWRTNTVQTGVTGADGKWRYMLYDLDFSADYFDDGRTLSGYNSLGSLYTNEISYNMIPMFYNLLNNEEFSQEFYNTYLEIMEENFSPKNVNAKADEYVARIGEAFRASNTRFGTEWVNMSYNDEVNTLKTYFNERYVYAKRYLDTLYGYTESKEGNSISFDASRMTHYGDASWSYDSDLNLLYADVHSVGVNEWDIQAQTSKLTLEKGRTYRISFEAACSVNNQIGVNINHQVGNSWPLCWSTNNINLTPELQSFSYVFTASADTASDWQICINYGSGIGKYTVGNIVVTEMVYSDQLVSELGEWSLYCPDGGSTLTDIGTDYVTVRTDTLPAKTWEAQPFYSNMVLEQGISYTYSFTVKADKAMDMNAHIQKNYGDYEAYTSEVVSVTNAPKTYTFTFTPNSSCYDASLCFDCGYVEGTVEISNVSVIRNG